MNKMFKMSSIAAALILSGVLAGCGDSTNGSSSNNTDGGGTTNVEKTSKTVTVIDGLVSGATVSVVGNTITGLPVAKTGTNGQVEVTYQKSLSSPTFKSSGGKTASGLPAPDMVSAGDTVINPYTTVKAAEGNVTKYLASMGVSGVSEKDALGNYATKADANFSKATVMLARVMYCENKDTSATNDNATQDATKAITALTATTQSDTVKAVKAAISNVNDSNKTVDQVEAAIAATLGSNYGCVKTTTTTDTTDHSKDGVHLPTVD